MEIPVLGFIPPHIGLDQRFNTFRLGFAWAKRVTVGQEILLMDTKAMFVFGTAVVEAIHQGELLPMCVAYAADNHTQLNAGEGAPGRLLAIMRKIYGPHIAPDRKKTTVIYLKRGPQ